MTHVISNLTLEVSPDEVDAAAELKLSARVLCTPSLDLRGHTLLIKDDAAAIVGTARIFEFDGEINSTGLVVLNAPARVGSHSWSLECPGRTTEITSFKEVARPFTVVVKPHSTRIVSWDVPSAVVAGERFRFKVGLRCSSACRLEGRQFQVLDGSGALMATGTVGCHPWMGSTALYYAEVEVEAPRVAGHYLWELKAPASAIGTRKSDTEIPHEERSELFIVRSVPSPESLVRVQVTDRERQAPLKGANVVMYPYRAVTDDRGVAKIWVANGRYRLQISRSNYVASSQSVDVAGDVSAMAELDRQPVVNPDDRYI